MEASDRINAILKHLDLNAKAFSEKIGMPHPQALYDIQRGKTKNISPNMADRIIKGFPLIDRVWLLTGEGDMMLTEDRNNGEVYVPETVMEVQIIPYSARAGSLGDYEQISNSDMYDTMLVPSDKIRQGKYLVFTVGGESMEDTLYHGDKVLARLVQRHLWEDSKLHIKRWGMWVIVTRTEGILIKHIIEHDVEGHRVLLHSFNPTYEDFWLDLENVVDIYNVVELVSRKL